MCGCVYLQVYMCISVSGYVCFQVYLCSVCIDLSVFAEVHVCA